LGATLPGVTTCTHFSVPAVLLGLWLYLQGNRRVQIIETMRVNAFGNLRAHGFEFAVGNP
jgi:hypothetical protein